VFQWLRLCISNVGVEGLNPGQGTNIPHAVWPKKKKKGIHKYMLKILMGNILKQSILKQTKKCSSSNCTFLVSILTDIHLPKIISRSSTI